MAADRCAHSAGPISDTLRLGLLSLTKHGEEEQRTGEARRGEERKDGREEKRETREDRRERRKEGREKREYGSIWGCLGVVWEQFGSF